MKLLQNFIQVVTLLAIIVLCIAAFTLFRKLTEVKQSNSELLHQFKVLSDSFSVQGSTTVIERPTFIDNIFKTDRSKFYAELLKQIPEAVQQELSRQNLSKSVTEINRTMLYLQGDSAVFKNADGVATKLLKIQPINSDSSFYVLVPQNIEVTNVRAEPDRNDPDNVVMYWTAINRTTGDTLKINQSENTRIATNKWKVKIRPSFSIGTTINEKAYFTSFGTEIVSYTNRKWEMNFLSPEIRYNFKNDLELNVKFFTLKMR